MVAAKMADLKNGQRSDEVSGTPIGGAAELLGVGSRSVDRAKAVIASGDEELLKQFDGRGQHMKKGDTPLSQHDAAANAGLSSDQQKQAVRVANIPADDFDGLVDGDRKDFNPSERVAITQTLRTFTGPGGDKRSDHSQNIGNDIVTTTEAAKKAGFGNEETFRQARKVVDQGAPELVKVRQTYLPAKPIERRRIESHIGCISIWVREQERESRDRTS